ncbi:hypothetical protein BCAR13_60167 [Paraburkholderia caribensis]|nr:hypothetical protein BCAR13_60167 [Paraburkholderia caribensis]
MLDIGEQLSEKLAGFLAEEAPPMPHVLEGFLPREPELPSTVLDLLVIHRLVPESLSAISGIEVFAFDDCVNYLALEVEILSEKGLHPVFERVAKAAVANAVAVALTEVRYLAAPTQVFTHDGLKPFGELFDGYTFPPFLADPALVDTPDPLYCFTEDGIFEAVVANVVRQDNSLMFGRVDETQSLRRVIRRGCP